MQVAPAWARELKPVMNEALWKRVCRARVWRGIETTLAIFDLLTIGVAPAWARELKQPGRKNEHLDSSRPRGRVN